MECCWCDDPAIGVFISAGYAHPCCLFHSKDAEFWMPAPQEFLPFPPP